MVPFNYRYLLDHAENIGGKVLDYGCGRAEIVSLGRQRGLDVWGTDTYSGHYVASFEAMPAETRNYVRPIQNQRADFPDGSFNVVISNQVLEHVTDPEATIADMRRLLRPGGTLIAAFPVRSTWYEGHVGLYFAHWMPRGWVRHVAFKVANWLHFGLYRDGLNADAWTLTAEKTLDDVCFYYPLDRMLAGLKTMGTPVDISVDYMRRRLGSRVRWIPPKVLSFVYHKRAGEIFTVVRTS